MIKTLRQIFLLILVLLASISNDAQNFGIDSLKLELQNLQGDERAICLLEIASEMSTIDLSSSIKFSNEALKLSEISNNTVLQANCRKDLGKYFFLQGRYDKAHICFGKSLVAYKDENYEQAYSETYIHIGQIFSREGLLDSADSCFQLALHWAKQNQDTIREISSLRSIGNIYYKKGQFDDALRVYNEGLVTASLISDKNQELASLYNNLGILFSDWNKYQKALEYYQKALGIEESLGNIKEQARIFNNIGTIYWYQDKLDSALIFYIKSLEGRDKINDINGKAYVLNNLGMYYGSLEDYAKSLEYFKKSLNYFESMLNRQGIIMTLYNIGSVYQEEKKYELSIKYFSQSLNLAEKHGFYDYIVANHESLKDVYSEMGEWQKAYESLSKYKTIKDSIREVQNIELISEMEVKFDKERKQAELQILKNQMQASQITKTRTLILIFGIVIILVLILISTYLFVRQIRIRTDMTYNKLNPALLRYQLNPQFINSSLSGIKELIAKTRLQESSVFLAGLAKLIRVFVETSTSNAIVLEKELETIQSFLKLHQLRYDYELKFELNIASHIETEMLAIPPFLFFPIYVHIIDNHLNKGKIKTIININTDENYLIIETEFYYFLDNDNKKSDEIDIRNWISKVEERVSLLNKTLKDKMYFKYKSSIDDQDMIKTIFLQLRLPIKPM